MNDETAATDPWKRATPKIPVSREARAVFLQNLETNAYENGYQAGFQAAQKRVVPEVLRLEALKAITAYASATGQTIQAFSEAMKSERGQL